MGLIQRLFTLSLGSKPGKKKQTKKKLEKPILQCQSTNNLLTTTYPNQDQAAVNRLLRSSSTHFSVLSETEYHSLPPIPHPINNLLREPSIISTQTTNTVNTYTVTIHQRTVHSRTEFPNANGTTSLLSTPSNSPQKNSHPIPPLTPGDKSRLETLRRDPSVLSLLNIFDDSGHPNPEAFANTPARQRRASTFKMLLGEQEPVEESSRELAKESDLSWAERCLQKAQRGSSDSLPSSLGMDEDLFKDDLSNIRGADDQLDMSMTSQSSSIVGSLEVELGTSENGSVVIRSPKSVLKEELLLEFLLQDDKHNGVEEETVPPPPKLSAALQTVPQPPRGPRPIGESEPKPRPRFTVCDGPQVKQTQMSPPPRKQQPPPLPPIPPDFQFKSVRSPKADPLGYRAPFEGLRNNGGLGVNIIPSGTTNRSVSVASSVYLQIETMPPPFPPPPLPPLPPDNGLDPDPYTPIPRRSMEERRGHEDLFASDQHIPPGAPPRPTKSQVRKFSKGPGRCRRNGKSETARQQSPKQTVSQTVKPESNEYDKENDENLALKTPKKSLVATLKAPEQPSPASSSKLSPQGRRMMDAVRAQMRSSRLTPRKWNPLVDNVNTMTVLS